jgi:hypothetical protein
MPKDLVLAFRLERACKARLERLARHRGCTTSALLRFFIERAGEAPHGGILLRDPRENENLEEHESVAG